MVIFTLNFRWILLSIAWLIVLPASMLAVSELISLLGIYHCVKLNGKLWERLELQQPGVESFSEKVKIILKVNIYLGLFFILAYSLMIYDALGHDKLNSYEIVCFSFILTLISLITIRLLANQSRFLVPKMGILGSSKDNELNHIKRFNEQTIGHFHTLVCTALIIIGIIISGNIITDQKILLFQPIPIGSFVYACCVYILALLIVTPAIELLLCFETFQPIHQIRSNTISITKETTDEKDITDELCQQDHLRN